MIEIITHGAEWFIGQQRIERFAQRCADNLAAAPVVDDNGQLCGAINLQDFYQAGIL